MNVALDILVAEDNADDLLLLEQAFKKAGVTDRLYSVCDGQEALAYLKGEAPYHDRAAFPWPDILLLDLNMPRINGFEVLEWVRQQSDDRALIVHVLTSSSRAEDVQRIYDLRANSYVVKPSRVDELIAFVLALHAWHQFVRVPTPSSHPSRDHVLFRKPVPLKRSSKGQEL